MNTDSRNLLAVAAEDMVAFGSFQLNRRQRILLKDGRPVAMGSRAMEILLALTEQAGQVLSNRELLRRVWPKTVVEDGTIRVHVALLRKVLRDAEPGSDYLHNITGRGYRFVAPIVHPRRPADPPPGYSSNSTVLRLPLRRPSRRNNLPLLPTPVLGREQTIGTLAGRLPRERFVTLVGAGGSGKTTVAIKVAEAVAASYSHGVCFVDLTSASGSEEVVSALAAALLIAPEAADPLPEILACLSQQSVLVVLDNCEHVIEAAARLAECVLCSASQVNILATSREPLRASGEFTHELTSLEVPLVCDQLSRENLVRFPALQLLIERAGACADAVFDDEGLRLLANVCRRLAGNPLAIEIAAAQVRWLGIRALAGGLLDDLYLSIEGRRTAQPRHRTLRASFDWSHDLLSPDEQVVFRRLSVFAGVFSSDLAAAVIADERLTHQGVLECLINLARKSLLAVHAMQGEVRYVLQDLPRAYAYEKLHQAQELTLMNRRHSQVWRRVGSSHIHAHARLWQFTQHQP